MQGTGKEIVLFQSIHEVAIFGSSSTLLNLIHTQMVYMLIMEHPIIYLQLLYMIIVYHDATVICPGIDQVRSY